MEKIKRDKLAAKIICTILAIALWFYVSLEENPSTSKTVRNVAVAITGEQALKENGFSVYSVSEKSVNVSVTAKRLSLGKITNKTLSAVVNVSSIKSAGEYVIPATVNASSANPSASYYVKGRDIKVVIEPIETRTFKIEPTIGETGNSSLILRAVEPSSKTVTVSAPKSIINEISAVTTEEIIPDNSDTTEAQGISLRVLGKNNMPLDGAECSPSSIDVSYSFYDVKTVPIILVFEDGTKQKLPSSYTAEIYGYGEDFEKITGIETEPVSQSKLKAKKLEDVKLVLPQAAKLCNKTSQIDIALPLSD